MEIRLYKDTPTASAPDPLRGDIHLSQSQSKRLSSILRTTAAKIPADFVLLTDRTGQMIASIGAMSDHELMALGSLMAADFAANEEIGRRFGERNNAGGVMLRESESGLTLMLPAGPRLALLVHTAGTVPCGWARLIALDAVKSIIEEADFTAPKCHKNADGIQPDISSEVEQAFDNLWVE